MSLVGWVDRCTGTAVEGWAGETSEPHRPVAVDVYVGPERTAQVLADRYRADLQQAGYGDGRKAFFCQIPTPAAGRTNPVEVKVCFGGTRQVVPNGTFVLPVAAAAAPPAPAA